MADAKISALTSATLPLAGTEVLPLVQSGVTKKVATDDLTVKNVRSNATTGLLQVAGPGTGTTRVMTAPDANFTVARTDAGQTFTGTQQFADLAAFNSLGVSILSNGQQVATTKSFVTLTGAGAGRTGCFLQNGSAAGQILYIRGFTWSVELINNPSGTQNAVFAANASTATIGNAAGQVIAMTLIWDPSYNFGAGGCWFEVGRSTR
jgi:hypothetical protein